MPKEQNIKTFTVTDIERYQKGLMTARERHALEKAALDDPFLADAIEGYGHATINANEDLAELRKRLDNRTGKTAINPGLRVSKSSFGWWKVAAMIIVVIGAGLLVYQFAFNTKSTQLAQAPKVTSVTTEAKDSVISLPSAVATDSNVQSDTAIINSNGDEKRIIQSNKSSFSRETKSELAGKKENTDADGTDDKVDRGTEKSSVPDNLEGLAKNKEAKTVNPVPKQEELNAKNRSEVIASGAVADVRYKKAEAKPNASGNAVQLNQAFVNQSNVFRGRVTDNNNNALPFSNITNLQDSVGTYSDARGYFVLTSPDSVLNVQIRSLGFETNNVQLSPANEENKIQLEEDKSVSASVLDTVKRNTTRSRSSTMTLDEPEPADGWNNYDMYLANNLKIPETFRSRQSSGTVELSFEVDKNGAPYNIQVKKSLCASCDKEAIRLIREGPKWKRKVKKGKGTVTVSF